MRFHPLIHGLLVVLFIALVSLREVPSRLPPAVCVQGRSAAYQRSLGFRVVSANGSEAGEHATAILRAPDGRFLRLVATSFSHDRCLFRLTDTGVRGDE